ncbi:hypothetical protein Cs7R123_61870 [Catellatospora sp. TT07R-123]|uniref:DUF4097 family beta strand repeat-containing protein n=1 Tax=Catellatospora sp. TT07R-123 TaxID=2733863 RepID=UPI001B1F0654|nr:DUF4097 family beta strand repeat-containing protein [Catellatospora sp. TT07R-123]GHJ48845.1 hypothetical protein Cs7R123_61870 [Catellatospora sp. TT07R-123]
MRTMTTSTIRRRLSAGLMLAAAALTVTGLAGCDDKTGLGGTKTEQQSQTYQHKVTKIEFNLNAGDISVSSADAADTVAVERKLEWADDKPEVKEEWAGDTLRITVHCKQPEHCSVSYTVRAPAAVSVTGKTGAGDLAITDVTGDIDLDTEAGDSTIRGTAGKLRINTTAGDIDASDLKSADAQLKTESGNVTARFAAVPTKVVATSTSGNIEVAVPKADSGSFQIKAETKAGDRKVDVTQDAASGRSIDATTESGNVSVVYA